MKKKEYILRRWLEIDLYSVALKAGLSKCNVVVDENLIFDSIRFLDFETSVNNKPDVNAIIGITALMWEHIDKGKYDIKELVVIYLSRIGYTSSAIICDDKFDFENCCFSALHSPLFEISSTINQLKNTIQIRNKQFILSDFQKEIWDALEDESIIGISAPTSAGKSFVILWKMIEILSDSKMDIVYVVPTLSLVNQVTRDFSESLKAVGIRNYIISNAYEQKLVEENHIYILTQEKAIASFVDESAFNDDLILIVDEIQNIERVNEDDDERAKTLFDTLIEFRRKKNVKKVILSGPRIEKIGTVGKRIFGKKSSEYSTGISPVLSLTYSIDKIGKKYYLKQYSSLRNDIISCEIEDGSVIVGYGKKQYNEKYMQFFNGFLEKTGGKQNIIFAPTAKKSREIALSLKGVPGTVPNDLIKYYSETVHPQYSLCKTLENGICYHHGKMPAHVRRTLERAIKEKMITNVVCTTTLLQGVNLPAQNVYIRNPHLYISKNKKSTELTNYEMANLRGRAGRLLKDFVGRTFVMDESGFTETEEYHQEELFEDVSKELPTGYEKTFEENIVDINNALANDKLVDNEMTGYGHLVTYIRQNILRYGMSSEKKMREVGITLSKEQIAAIKSKLDKISVSKEICAKNRYWDPFVLDSIYNNYSGSIPKTIYEKGIRNQLDRIISFLRDMPETNAMFCKYVPDGLREKKGKAYLISLIIDWTSGKTLKEIFSSKHYNEAATQDRIENTIRLLENTVSYGIPLLLKPLFDIYDPDGTLLSSMQVGASDILSRRMIEKGIPRDTAINIINDYLDDGEKLVLNQEMVNQMIQNSIKKHYYEFPYWVQIQVDYLI
ncbi:MAG: DEAD/DEAH box helicase [Lachnospiraceae bacterium]|nr:DEAD/DEAH box helicase [Lachnospiraceae bacterium]